MKKCSFVIPSYNSAAWLAHAIESCQKQTYANLEIVVVDDGSTDSTHLLMDHLSPDKRIKYLRLDKNVGRSEARNIGNKAAAGDYILVLDADDIAYPDRARLTVEKLKKADMVYGSADQMDILGNKGGTYQADVFNKDRAIKDKLNYIVHSTLAYRKEIADRYKYRGGQISDLGIDDWAFELEVAFSGARMEHIQSPVSAYRENMGIVSRRDPKAVDAAKTAFLGGFLAKAA